MDSSNVTTTSSQNTNSRVNDNEFPGWMGLEVVIAASIRGQVWELHLLVEQLSFQIVQAVVAQPAEDVVW